MDKIENKLEINQSIRESLGTMTYWSKFLAIIGFIGIGFMVIAAIGFIIGGSMLENFGQFQLMFTVLYPLIYIALAILYFFPVNYMYRFAVKSRNALNSNSQENLDSGLSNLASSYKYIGVMTIVIISLYALIFIISIASLGIASFMN